MKEQRTSALTVALSAIALIGAANAMEPVGPTPEEAVVTLRWQFGDRLLQYRQFDSEAGGSPCPVIETTVKGGATTEDTFCQFTTPLNQPFDLRTDVSYSNVEYVGLDTNSGAVNFRIDVSMRTGPMHFVLECSVDSDSSPKTSIQCVAHDPPPDP